MIYVNARAIIERISDNDGITEIIVQERTKKGQEYYEFPGGQVNQFESLFAALKREVKEETGLDILEATGQNAAVETGEDFSFKIECFQPYAVYQTLKGPVDSMGVYFKCKVTGEILCSGDDTKNIKWIKLDELNALLNEKNAFSDVDRAAAIFFLNDSKI